MSSTLRNLGRNDQVLFSVEHAVARNNDNNDDDDDDDEATAITTTTARSINAATPMKTIVRYRRTLRRNQHSPYSHYVT